MHLKNYLKKVWKAALATLSGCVIPLQIPESTVPDKLLRILKVYFSTDTVNVTDKIDLQRRHELVNAIIRTAGLSDD